MNRRRRVWRRTLAGASALASGGYLALTGVRVWLAHRAVQRRLAAPIAGSDADPERAADQPGAGVPQLSVLQPIRSGDPLLAQSLSAALAGLPASQVIWLVDADDPEAQRVCRRLAEQAEREGRRPPQIVECPPWGGHSNPKVDKLVLGRRLAGDAVPGAGLLAVLDDDSALPPGAIEQLAAGLADADLVTALPFYQAQPELWSRLLASWVNGSSALTYLPLAELGAPVTINGMCYLTSQDALAKTGGFEAIADRLCDDWELARSYRRAGLRIAQAAVPVQLATTVPDLGRYLALMRRWTQFAGQLLGSERSAPTVLLVLLPAVLPPVALAAALVAGSAPAAGLAVTSVSAKALASRWLRRRIPQTPPDGPGSFWLEQAADWTLPAHQLSALVFPHRITWRGRRMRVRDGILQ